MKIREFFEKVDGARSLCEDIMEHDVKVRFVSRDGIPMSDHFDLTQLGYFFSPILVREDGTRGSLILEFKEN
jgi:hypothetical protein